MPDRTKCFHERVTPSGDSRIMCGFQPSLTSPLDTPLMVCTRSLRSWCPFFKPASMPNAFSAGGKEDGDDQMRT